MLTAAPVPVAETRTRRPRLSAAERTNGLACPRSGVRTGTREGPFAGAHGGVGEPRGCSSRCSRPGSRERQLSSWFCSRKVKGQAGPALS